MSLRLVLSAGLLAALLAAAGALAWWSHAAAPGGPGEHHVAIVGPDGALFEGFVHVEQATALSALEAAAAQAGLAVEKEEYPGMGTYVRAIGGHEAAGSEGWIYEVRRDGGWVLGDRSAARYALQPGDALRWRWSTAAGA